MPKDAPLLTHPNVLVTPHIGGSTSDIAGAMISMLTRTILALQGGREIEYTVNRPFLRTRQ